MIKKQIKVEIENITKRLLNLQNRNKPDYNKLNNIEKIEATRLEMYAKQYRKDKGIYNEDNQTKQYLKHYKVKTLQEKLKENIEYCKMLRGGLSQMNKSINQKEVLGMF